MGTLDYGRDAIDMIIRDVGNDWWRAAADATPSLLNAAILSAAASNQVDNGYLRWLVFHYRKAWLRMPGATMLDVARRLYLEASSKPPIPDERSLPSDMASERRAQKALGDIIRWSNGAYVDQMAAILVNLAGPASDQVRDAVVEAGGDRMSPKQAKMVILVELPLRLRDHPHWFRDPGTMQSLAKAVLG